MFASGINKNTKKFAPKITQRRKAGGPTPTPAFSSGPSDAPDPAIATLPADSIPAPNPVQDQTVNLNVPISAPLSPQLTSQTLFTPAPTPTPLPNTSHHDSAEIPFSAGATESSSNENKIFVPSTVPQPAVQQQQQQQAREIDTPGSPIPAIIREPSPPVKLRVQPSQTAVQEPVTIAPTVQTSTIIAVEATEIAVPILLPRVRATPTDNSPVQPTAVPAPIANPRVIPTIPSAAPTAIATPQPASEELEDLEPRKRRRLNAPSRLQYTPQNNKDDEDEEMEDVEEIDDDRDEDYEEEVQGYKPTENHTQEEGTLRSDVLEETSIAARNNTVLSAANSGANTEAESEGRSKAERKGKGKAQAKASEKPRAPRKKKIAETEAANGADAAPSSIPAPKKARAPRKPKNKLVQTPAEAPVEAEGEGDVNRAATTDGETPRPVRRRGRKREVTPPNSESIQIAPGIVKMGDLCRDTKIGRKSKRFVELEKFDWTEVERKQREKKAAMEAAKAVGEGVPPSESIEQRLERIAQESEAARPPPQRHAMQVRVVNGQIVLDEETLHVDRRELVQEDAPRDIVEESSLTRKVNSATWGKREKSERWDVESTDRFYEGLGMFGTDFELISGLFPDRSRRQIKNKFNAEERKNPARVTAALRNRVDVDIEEYSRVTNIEYGDARELDRELEEMRAQHEEEERAAAEAVKELDRERREMQEAAAAATGENVIGVMAAPQKRRGKGKQSQFVSRHQGGGEEVVLGLI